MFCWIFLLDHDKYFGCWMRNPVSILVLLDFPFGPGFLRIMRFSAILVSILVLLDFPFGPVNERLHASSSILVLLDFPFGLTCRPANSVSILVLLDFPFGRAMCGCSISHRRLFQSLFCWIFLLDLLNVARSRPCHRGFNPCSVGFSFWTSLLVLLQICTAECFNPCSVGFSFWTYNFGQT